MESSSVDAGRHESLGLAARLVAHRGHAEGAPENTLAAVRDALELGARQVEIDVQLSADGVPYLFHDRSLDRLCGVPGRLVDLEAEAIAALRASEPGRFGAAFRDEPVPKLTEVLELIAGTANAHLFVELKRAALEVFGPGPVLEAVLGDLRPWVEPPGAPLAGRCTLISFDLEVLQLARRLADEGGWPALPVGPVLEAWTQLDEPDLVTLEPDVIFCNRKRLPRGRLDAGAPLVVYEIGDLGTARELVERGAAGIETFAVGRLLAELDEVGETSGAPDGAADA